MTRRAGRCPAAPWGHRRRRLGAGEVPLLQRRQPLPDPATGGRPPADTDEVAAALEVGREFGVPLTMRGAGTSIAGNAVGAGIVVDTSRHLNQVLALDREARTALVQPGVVHAGLQKLALPAGLRFGPDPSTHTRCTIGGMIGNNACGSRALGYGRTVDNVEALTVLLADGSGRCVRSATPVVEEARNEPSRNHATGDVARPRRPAPRGRPHRVRSLRPPGLRLLLRAPAPRERPPVRPVPGRHRGHPGRRPRRDRAPGRGRSVPRAGGARLPDDGRRGGRRTRPAGAPPGRLRGPRPADRRHGAAPSRAPGRRWLAVRRGHRCDRGGGAVPRRRGRPHCRRTAPHRHRHPGAAGAVADPRGRRRPGGPFAEPARAGRLGGRRRAARQARRLPARLRRAAEGERAGRRSLRPLRRRLRARADRLRARGRRGPGQVSASSWRAPPTWWRRTAARCPASTATAGRARSCCRGCTRRRRSR